MINAVAIRGFVHPVHRVLAKDRYANTLLDLALRRNKFVTYRHLRALDLREAAAVEHLRRAGCSCPVPLVGYRPNIGPRCRLCNTQAETRSASTS